MKTIRDIIPADPVVVTVPVSATALEAAELMTEKRVGAVLVLGADGLPCGIFTERDLMTRVVVKREALERITIGEKMTGNLFMASPDRPVDAIAREMRQRHIRHLPVVKDGKLLALLSFRDLLDAHLHVAEGEVEALTSYIQGTPDIEPND